MIYRNLIQQTNLPQDKYRSLGKICVSSSDIHLRKGFEDSVDSRPLKMILNMLNLYNHSHPSVLNSE